MKTRECIISELKNDYQTLINNLLNGEEPLCCYETEQTGFLGFYSVIVLSKSEIIHVSDPGKSRYEIMNLGDIVKITGNEQDNMSPHICIYGSRKEEYEFSFLFETNQMLFTFTNQLRQAIGNNK